ncbi:copper chaperone PCu(A)C [Streptomyces sp. NPDC093109]|uniref:copper chaperone PCu(A)C n=1 Tax=Streptomyces sp. NPDC093109 TaxID=3154977 RepID=UPI00344C4149
MTSPAATHPTTTGWQLTRGRLRDTLTAATAPVIACVVALGALTTWVNSGAAGSRPQLAISSARIFLPYGDGQYTSAYFRIDNSGDADDELLSVTSPVMAEAMLNADRDNGKGGAVMTMVDKATVPGGSALTMSPYGINVMVKSRTKPHWELGDTVPFVLHFRHSGPQKSVAVVITPTIDTPTVDTPNSGTPSSGTPSSD